MSTSPLTAIPLTRVLLIRAEAQAASLATMLTEAGIVCQQQSFLQVKGIDNAAEQAAEITRQTWHGGITVSQHAGMYADKYLQQQNSLWPQARWFSVGPSSARATARLAGFPVICPWQVHQSESLLQLPELQQVAGQRWLIIRGNGGRELLADSLRARGAEVHYWQVYQRTRRDVDGAACFADWQNNIGVIVVTSAEQLGYFLASMPQNALSWLQQCRWVVSSERLAALVPAVPRSQIHISGSAVDHALLTHILSAHQATESAAQAK